MTGTPATVQQAANDVARETAPARVVHDTCRSCGHPPHLHAVTGCQICVLQRRGTLICHHTPDVAAS